MWRLCFPIPRSSTHFSRLLMIDFDAEGVERIGLSELANKNIVEAGFLQFWKKRTDKVGVSALFAAVWLARVVPAGVLGDKDSILKSSVGKRANCFENFLVLLVGTANGIQFDVNAAPV